MKSFPRLIGVLLVLAAPGLSQAAALAVPGPERLPEDTWILVNWHGVAEATKVKGTNPVMRLWGDPQLVTARQRIATMIAGNLGRNVPAAESRAAVESVLAVLENPIVVGFAGDPLGPAPADGLGKVHMFAVLNLKGREQQWARLRALEKPAADARLSTLTMRGVQVSKTVRTSTTEPADNSNPQARPPQPRTRYAFEATLGDYALYSDNQVLMDALIARLQEKNPAAAPLLQDPAYQRAQRFRADGSLLEVFLKIPDLSRIPIPPMPQVDMAAALRELHPERAQGLWFSAGMGRDRMMIRAALLGDTTPGSVMDLLGGNVTEFQTLSVAPVTESYGAFRLDLPALYATVLRAVKSGMPPEQGAAAGMLIDGVVMAQTGMRAAELLSLVTGEIAVASTGEERLGSKDALPALLMLPVTRSEPVLALLRRIAAPLFQNEEKIAGATVVKIETPPAANQPGVAPETSPPFYLAISPRMLAVSPDRSQLSDALTREASGTAAPAGSLAADPTFRTVRRTFPAQLNGISYTDMSRVRWDTYVEAMRRGIASQREEQLARAARIERGEGDSAPDPRRAAELRAEVEQLGALEKMAADVFPLMSKYLKVGAGGSWKAPDGVFFDSYVN